MLGQYTNIETSNNSYNQIFYDTIIALNRLYLAKRPKTANLRTSYSVGQTVAV